MKRSRFAEEQIIGILRQAEADTVRISRKEYNLQPIGNH